MSMNQQTESGEYVIGTYNMSFVSDIGELYGSEGGFLKNNTNLKADLIIDKCKTKTFDNRMIKTKMYNLVYKNYNLINL